MQPGATGGGQLPHNATRPPQAAIASVLGGSLGFVHTLLQTLGTTMTAAVQFFLALDLLVSHVFLPIRGL